jgi:hypothetical protein
MKLKNTVALSESGFIFNAARGESYTANPIGMDILNLLQQGLSKEEIHRKLIDTYEVDAATLEKDISDFLQMLQKNNLVEL